MLITETNRYQAQEKHKYPNKHKGKWYDVNKQEMQAICWHSNYQGNRQTAKLRTELES